MGDETMRNTVSREHFELAVEDCELCLLNLSGAGTLVNGKGILDRVRVESRDVISVRTSMHDDTPILSFSLTVAGHQMESPEDVASTTEYTDAGPWPSCPDESQLNSTMPSIPTEATRHAIRVNMVVQRPKATLL